MMTAKSFFRMGDRDVGSGAPCLVVAEVAQAHGGDVLQAHRYIELAAGSRADAVKFQTHLAHAESTLYEPWRVKCAPDASRYDYWKRMEFTEAEWRGLREDAISRDLIFLSSPFSVEAAELLARVGVPAWKVGAGEVCNSVLLQYLAASGLPVILSTGMSPWREIDDAVSLISPEVPVAVMQCTSSYPCSPERVGLNVIADLRSRYGCPVGLSDHTGAIYASLAAAALGADLVEVHLTASRDLDGPDVSASVTPEELRQLVDGIRAIEQMLASPVDKDALTPDLESMRRLFTKSVVARGDLPEGTILEREHLAVKKPGSGMPAARLPSIIGKRLRRVREADSQILENDLEEVK